MWVVCRKALENILKIFPSKKIAREFTVPERAKPYERKILKQHKQEQLNAQKLHQFVCAPSLTTRARTPSFKG